MNDYIAALLFFLPAGIANMSPILANKIPFLNKWKAPIDFGKKYHGKPILGENKTWRGLAFGTIMGGLSAIIISKLNQNTVVDITPVAAGLLLGFGALAGDAIESFFKRLCGLASGESWFPFDQIDYIIGGVLVIWPFVHLPLWAIATIFVVYFGLHVLFSYIGFLLHLKDKPI